MSAIVAFSASLTCTPPIPRKPPSDEASATFWLMLLNQALKAGALDRNHQGDKHILSILWTVLIGFIAGVMPNSSQLPHLHAEAKPQAIDTLSVPVGI